MASPFATNVAEYLVYEVN